MKAILIMLVIGLSGCASIKEHHGQYFGFPPSYAGEPKPGLSNNGHESEGSDPYVRNLSKEAESALAKVGVKDIAFIAVIDNNGTIRLLTPEDVKHKRVTLSQDTPLLNNGLTSLESIAMASYKGSHCWFWKDGTEVDKQGRVIKLGAGRSLTIGGTVYAGAGTSMCRRFWGPHP